MALAVPEICEAVKLSEEAAYTKAELAAYDTYWDTISTEKTLYSERFQKGRVEGKVEERVEMLLFLLQHKFKEVPEHYRQKIEQANPDLLRKWVERGLTGITIEDIFKD